VVRNRRAADQDPLLDAVPDQKGAALLRHLESFFGRPAFDAWLKEIRIIE